MGCGCQSGEGDHWDNYLSCGQVRPQPLVDDSILVNYAASNGARSSDWTLCYSVACMKARRMIYWKVNPGDCGSSAFDFNNSATVAAKVGSGVAIGAKADPEPISKAILTGVATITNIFGAHHAQAVATEETVGCSVAAGFNSAMISLENAVSSGMMNPQQASQVLSQIGPELDQNLQTIAKPGNFGSGMRIALRAVINFSNDIVFGALTPTALSEVPVAAPAASPGAPGTYVDYSTNQGGIQVPPAFPVSPSYYQGASGYTPTPLNANNVGVGATASLQLPGSISPGTIVLIGGAAFVASRL
jgi:hypothetical protein